MRDDVFDVGEAPLSLKSAQYRNQEVPDDAYLIPRVISGEIASNFASETL